MRSQEDVAAMQCPVCRVPLAMTDRQGIEIDYCPQCRGVWLDRGELDKIVERSAPAAAAVHAPPPPTQDRAGGPSPWAKDRDYGAGEFGYQDSHGYAHGDRRHGHGKPHKRRKSFLEELFD